MSLKILGGALKGRTIRCPNTESTRPVTSFLRKSIFDTCQFYIEGARILDAFAGSGAIGLEALSRGASFACFVDNNDIAIRCLRQNIENLKVKEQGFVFHGDAFRFLQEYERAPFDILFIDPPYPIGLEGYKKLLTTLHSSGAVGPASILFLEAPSQLAIPLRPHIENLFTIKKERRSSSTTLFNLVKTTNVTFAR